jgi:hypothetical protein
MLNGDVGGLLKHLEDIGETNNTIETKRGWLIAIGIAMIVNKMRGPGKSEIANRG